MLKMGVMLFTFLVQFHLAAPQLDADQPVARYAGNKPDFNPNKRMKMMSALRKRGCCPPSLCDPGCDEGCCPVVTPAC
uniref:M superfamily MLKM group conopeptide Lv3-1-DEG02 n=1 Tax=Conus lividus TaxID=89426 RepID=H2BK94_CONLI|nr:M superfamily MLKM group conopeptide Lv3-1-DEG02 [Conus lividus]